MQAVYNLILVIINKFNKYTYFIFYKKATKTKSIAYIII